MDVFDNGNACVFDFPSIAAYVNRKPQPSEIRVLDGLEVVSFDEYARRYPDQVFNKAEGRFVDRETRLEVVVQQHKDIPYTTEVPFPEADAELVKLRAKAFAEMKNRINRAKVENAIKTDAYLQQANIFAGELGANAKIGTQLKIKLPSDGWAKLSEAARSKIEDAYDATFAELGAKIG